MGTGRRLHPPDDEPHRRGVRLGLERGVSRLGNIGGAVHPVGNGSPVLLRYRPMRSPGFCAGRPSHDRRRRERGRRSRCRPAPAGPGTANPAHRFTQEVGGATSGVGPALAQPGHQHVAGAGGDGQQRVIAPRDRRSRRWWSPGQWSRVPPRPASPGQQLPAHPVQLANVAPWKLRRKVPRVDGALTVQGAGRPSGAQRIGSSMQHRPPAKRPSVAGVGPARGVTQIQALLQLGKAEVVG